MASETLFFLSIDIHWYRMHSYQVLIVPIFNYKLHFHGHIIDLIMLVHSCQSRGQYLISWCILGG